MDFASYGGVEVGETARVYLNGFALREARARGGGSEVDCHSGASRSAMQKPMTSRVRAPPQHAKGLMS